MLYIAAKLNINKSTLTLAKAHCANTERHFMKDERSIKAVDIAIAFGEGRSTDNELIAAANAAAEVAANAFTAASYYAANAAAATANANATKTVHYNSAYAAYYIAAVAAAYASSKNKNSARKENEKLTADICRKYLTEYVLEKINEYDCENL